jgi:hypothetical protein
VAAALGAERFAVRFNPRFPADLTAERDLQSLALGIAIPTRESLG